MLKRAGVNPTTNAAAHVSGHNLNKFKVAAATFLTFRKLGLNVHALMDEGGEHKNQDEHSTFHEAPHITATEAGLIGRSYGVKPGTTQTGPAGNTR